MQAFRTLHDLMARVYARCFSKFFYLLRLSLHLCAKLHLHQSGILEAKGRGTLSTVGYTFAILLKVFYLLPSRTMGLDEGLGAMYYEKDQWGPILHSFPICRHDHSITVHRRSGNDSQMTSHVSHMIHRETIGYIPTGRRYAFDTSVYSIYEIYRL